jgi:hypothetical protein
MPTILGTSDHEFHFSLARSDEYAFSGSGDTELLIDVVSTTLVADTVQVVLRLDEIDALVDRLLTEKARARFLSAPVVKQVAA